MEFEDVGAHCQYEGCNQKDFLPFKCDSCSKRLCLIHRSYVAHDCHGSKLKDMTSIDCPICGKGVKFDKSQDVNAVWEHHHLHECSHHAPAHPEKVVMKCFKPGCNTTLGPSNKFTCSKCHMNVCLSHRIPEEHNCVGPIRKEFLERVQKNMKVGNADKPEKKVEKKHVGIFHQFDKKEKERILHSNNAGADAHNCPAHHHPHAPSHPPHTTPIACPFCSLSHETDAALVDHILAFHPDDGHGQGHATRTHAQPPIPPVSVFTSLGLTGHTSSVPAPDTTRSGANSSNNNGSSNDNNNSSSAAAALHREVCPLCHARFPDAISLVRHFESIHAERAQAATTRPADSTAGGCAATQGPVRVATIVACRDGIEEQFVL